jgi:uncharacterized protein YndB with AHSA1/START domain
MAEEIRQGDIPGVQLRYRHHLTTTPEIAWSWLTRLEKQSLWLADRATPDPSTTSTVLLESVDSSGRSTKEKLVPVRAVAPHRWIVDLQDLDGTWPVPTRVEFELTPSSEGTEISVLQKGFAHLPLSDCLTIWESYRRRWRHALASLSHLIQNDT